MGRAKQIIVLTLILFMVGACVYLGIQIKNRPEMPEEEVVYQGSYRENVITLPVINEAGGEEYLQLVHGVTNIPELYTVLYNEDRTMVRGYKKYILGEDQKWTEDESTWMTLEYFSETNRVIQAMSYADTGTLYALLHDLSVEEPVADEVVRVTTAGKIEHVGVRGLYKTEEDGSQIALKKMFIADNSICITDANYNSYAYSLANGELHATGKNGAYGSLASDGKYLYLLTEDCNTVLPYQYSDGTAIKPRQINANAPSLEDACSKYAAGDYQLLCEGEELYLTSSDGLYRFDMNSVSWDKLLSGTDCLFGKPSVSVKDFVAIGDHLYMLGKSLTGTYCFAMYDTRSEDEDKAYSRTPFYISSYRRSPMITEAAVAFQHKNPSLEVIYDVALEKNPQLTLQDYRTQIQTALAQGNAADIVVCDDIDYALCSQNDSFENISDLMKPLYTAADLYGNITNALSQTKIFVTPAKFDVFLHYGNATYLNAVNSLENLANVSTQKETKLLGTQYAEDLSAFFVDFFAAEYSKQNVLSAEFLAPALTNLLNSAKLKPAPIPVEETAETDTPAEESTVLPEPYDYLPRVAKIDTIATLNTFIKMLADSEQIYTVTNSRFLPHDLVAISAKTKNSKAARDFIRMMYSADVQGTNVGDGIPMSSHSVLAINDREEYASLTEAELNQFDLRMKALDCPYYENEKLCGIICEILPPLFEGEIDAETAAQQIMNHMK